MNVAIVFRISQGVRSGVGAWYTLYRCDLLATENDLRSQEKTILMRNCGSYLIIAASWSIIRTTSKNGVLGGDKHKFIMIIWGGASPLPRPHPLERINKLRKSLDIDWIQVFNNFDMMLTKCGIILKNILISNTQNYIPMVSKFCHGNVHWTKRQEVKYENKKPSCC